MEDYSGDTFGVEKLTTLSKLNSLWDPGGGFLVMIRPFRGSGLERMREEGVGGGVGMRGSWVIAPPP